MKKEHKKLLKWLLWLVLSPIILFLVLAILVYIPPVQDFIVQRVAASLSSSMNMDVAVGHVRLAFPLDLAVHEVSLAEKGDTLVAVRSLRLDVRLLPLFSGRADVDGFEVYDAQLNTKQLVGDTYIRGRIGQLEAKSHGVEWENGLVRLDETLLKNADLCVALSDTAAVDTAKGAPWKILTDRIELDNVKVKISMPGDSMRLMAALGKAVVEGGNFDTGKPYYAVRNVSIENSAVTYASHPSGKDGRLGNDAFAGNTQLLWEGFSPTSGFDPSCIELMGLQLQADSISYDAVGRLCTNVRHVAFNERSGLYVKNLSGKVYMDSMRLSLPALKLQTPHSTVNVQVDLAMKALEAGSAAVMQVGLDARIGARDVKSLGVGFVPDEYLKMWPDKTLTLSSTLSGNVEHLTFKDTKVFMPVALNLELDGAADHLMSGVPVIAARFKLRQIEDGFVKSFLPKDVRNSFALPRGMTASGTVSMRGDDYKADVRMNALRGNLVAKASVNTVAERYTLDARASAFPLGSFLPGSGLGAFTGDLKANGKYFDVLSARAQLEAKATVRDFRFDKYNLGGITLDAKSVGGKAVANFNAANALLEGSGTLKTDLNGDIAGQLTADLPFINIQQLAGMEDTLHLGTSVDISFFANEDFTAYGVNGGLRYIRFLTPVRSIPAKDLNVDFSTNRDTTTALVSAGDLYLNLGSKGDVTRLAGQFSHFAGVLAKQIENKSVDQEKLKSVLPAVDLTVDVGTDNPLSKILYYKGISYNSATVSLNAYPSQGVDGRVKIDALKSGKLLLDNVSLKLYQDNKGFCLDGYAKNYTKKNPNKFEVRLNSYIRQTEIGTQLTFLDEEGDKGIDLGLKANLKDEGLNVSLFPHHPIIAYRNFTVNTDNFIYLGKDRQIQADVDLVADDGTGLKISCAPNEKVNDLMLSLINLNLGELCNVMPYLPQMTGLLNADVHIIDEHVDKTLSAAAALTARQLTYEGMDLGNIGMEGVYMPKEGGEHHANAYISYNDIEVMDCEGTYYSNGDGRFDGQANLHDFPLQMLNGFLAGSDIALKGIAGGNLHIVGNMDSPAVNGVLDFDSAHLYSDVYGFNFLMDERPIEIKDNRMNFTDYALYSQSKGNPLVMTGALDFSDLSRINMDFTMKANNFELINARRTPLSVVFGKVYANYAGTLRGTPDNMSIRGKLEVLERTDMTYILKDSPLSVDDRLDGLVKFVDFSDTTTVEAEPAVMPGGFDLTLGISISDAARFRCNLSDDGSNYVNLEGGGNLTMRLTQQGEMRLTGRFTANSGDMKYSLPVIPLKTFNIVQGSYVDFTGDVLNPTLNIAAKERVKATVTENDQPRSVAFDVGVALSKPLSDMGLEFTIEAPEDLNVQNQLASMSADQRSKTAVAMLATGMYMTDDMLTGSGSGFKASNALNAFLQSEIQNIAGSALKTLDITVGMENNTSSTGTETTDYSFQFAKRFWNNRISVIIGGKVSTGQDAQNSAASFIDNVAVEYRLDKSSTRYVKVFYDRSKQDPLEGELTQTGAGLVLRRKTNKLGELFIFSNRKKDKDKEKESQTER